MWKQVSLVELVGYQEKLGFPQLGSMKHLIARTMFFPHETWLLLGTYAIWGFMLVGMRTPKKVELHTMNSLKIITIKLATKPRCTQRLGHTGVSENRIYIRHIYIYRKLWSMGKLSSTGKQTQLLIFFRMTKTYLTAPQIVMSHRWSHSSTYQVWSRQYPPDYSVHRWHGTWSPWLGNPRTQYISEWVMKFEICHAIFE